MIKRLKLLIFGNSGSGKSTLAKQLSGRLGLAHLDLDTVAWKQDRPGEREDLTVSLLRIEAFQRENRDWVMEGCYSGLLSAAAASASHMVFLNPGIEQCLDNCRNRPWEPHKYESSKAQDDNLEMLLNWVADYGSREDEFSLAAHCNLFDSFTRSKRQLTKNTHWENVLEWLNRNPNLNTH